MSANNQIIISKSSFKVWHVDVDDADENGVQDKDLIGTGKDLVEAIEIAQKEENAMAEDGFPVEYGISFIS